jgi:hypothetical protein
MQLRVPHFIVVLSLMCIHCHLPTAPENAHSALVSDASVTTERGRAAAPLGHRLAPPCASPAPLSSARPQDRAPGYIFGYRSGTDATAVTAELAAKYGFSPKFVYNGLPGFAAVVSEQALAAIRCDSRVQSVEYDVFSLPGEG